MSWREKIKNFLSAPGSPVSLSGVGAASAALNILRMFSRVQLRPLIVTLPDAARVDRLIDELAEFCRLLNFPLKILAVPECGRGKLLFPGGETRRARALSRILDEKFDLVIGSVHAMLGPAPLPETSEKARLELRPGMKIPMSELLERLVVLDYDDEVMVSVSGEFARRCGIIDVFSPAHDEPCRIEFFGDEIDTMRFFSPETQRSTGKAERYEIINRAGITAGGAAESDAFAYLERRGDFSLLDLWPEESSELLEKYSVPGANERWKSVRKNHPSWKFFDDPPVSGESCQNSILEEFLTDTPETLPDAARKSGVTIELELLKRRIADFAAEGGSVLFLAAAAEDTGELRQWCRARKLISPESEFDSAVLRAGFILSEPPLLVVTEPELAAAGFVHAESGEAKVMEAGEPEEPEVIPDNTEFSLSDFDEGDYVVHLDYGIGIYRGLTRQESNGEIRELMRVEYRDGRMLLLPLIQANKLSRYLGAVGKVHLHAIGGARWDAEKSAAGVGVRAYAADMLRFQAVRQATKGIAFHADAKLTASFLRAFPFKDTNCQLRATAEIRKDMLSEKPMDRLLCGDVGYGKTEIAMRAAFRAAAAGYQVAVIAPTTVLAQQHYRSFVERFREYPFVIDCVGRFRTAGEERLIAAKLASGGIDILIGTQRLCGNSFQFKNLGLVIIDEEQRFGVDQKERLRRFRVEADVLSMSATPIPRTLYLAMAGARDLSTLMTPPKMRLPVKTVIAPQEDELIAAAIRAELARGGQVYYLHNRVQTIEHCAESLRALLPDARIGVAHGQMPEHQLEEVMSRFINGSVDCLVCSTIIESGLDIPNANTILIENADRFGLAQLYQLRGRVGRWKNQAYAYMLLPKNRMVGSTARKRLAAIRRCSTLGAGFQLALRDLEIRGSGNLLGSEQSGHLNMIGFDLYCRLLKMEVARLKGVKEELLEDVEIGIDFIRFAIVAPAGCFAASVPESYIDNDQLRISVYRRLGSILKETELDNYMAELRDRYGKIPPELELLASVSRLRILAARAGYRKLTVVNGTLSLTNPGGVVYRENGRNPRIDYRDSIRLRMLHLTEILRRIPEKNGYPER